MNSSSTWGGVWAAYANHWRVRGQVRGWEGEWSLPFCCCLRSKGCWHCYTYSSIALGDSSSVAGFPESSPRCPFCSLSVPTPHRLLSTGLCEGAPFLPQVHSWVQCCLAHLLWLGRGIEGLCAPWEGFSGSEGNSSTLTIEDLQGWCPACPALVTLLHCSLKALLLLHLPLSTF